MKVWWGCGNVLSGAFHPSTLRPSQRCLRCASWQPEPRSPARLPAPRPRHRSPAKSSRQRSTARGERGGRRDHVLGIQPRDCTAGWGDVPGGRLPADWLFLSPVTWRHHVLLCTSQLVRDFHSTEQGQVSGETQWESPGSNASAPAEQGGTGRLVTHGSFTFKKARKCGSIQVKLGCE